jgi:hypothetical protein
VLKALRRRSQTCLAGISSRPELMRVRRTNGY